LIRCVNRWLPWTSLALPCALVLAIGLTGCGKSSGPELAPVSGRVTLDGQPMYGARLRFQPEAGGGSPSSGTTDQDGQYELSYKRGQKGAQIGWHKVRIDSAAELPGPNGKPVRPPTLPPRYNVQSELRKEVKSDEENEFNFELTSQPK
jgi:hypothetical protein